MNRLLYILAIFLCAIITVNVLAGEIKEVVLDAVWYSTLQNSNPLTRLQMLEDLKNTLVKGQGIVAKVDESSILKKKYRIILLVNLPKMKIMYYCYTDKEDYFDLLQQGDTFEFSGQFIVATPINTKVDTIICDIILEDGAVIVK